LKIGYVSHTLPVSLPCHLEGYQDRIAVKQHDDLSIKTLYIKSHEEIIIHVVDAIIIEKRLADECKELLSQKYGFSKDAIFIVAIHTHSAPKISHILNPEIEPDVKFIQNIKDIILDNSEYVIKNCQDAKVSLGTTAIDGLYSNRNGLHLPYYQQALILHFEDFQGRSIVDVVNMACHPTILNGSNLEVSTDYVGVLRATYQQETGRELLFINGECGDVSTRLTRQGTGFEEVQRVGQGIAKQLSQVQFHQLFQLHHQTIKKYVINIDYEPQKDEFLCNMQEKLKNAEKIFSKKDQRYFMKNIFLEKVQEKLQKDKIIKQAEASIIEFDELRIITIPGEIVYHLAHQLRNIDEKPTIIMAYTNGFLGYAVDKEEYGLYFETFMSEYPLGYADALINEMINLVKGENHG